jgi:HPt (histidine-containing phosphotransfer) domain-containing protein
MESEDYPVLDPETISELLDLDEGVGDFLDELIEAYNSDCPIRISAIEECLMKGDAEGISRAAHALKGSSGNIGAKRLMSVAHKMERAGKSSEWNEASKILESIRYEYQSAKSAFVELRKK